MRVHRISVPTPFKVGPVNVYLIEEDPLTVIDTGPYTDEAIKALREGLAKLGYGFQAIKRIIISHAHADHFGMARAIVEESGAAVYIHSWDAHAVVGSEDYVPFKGLLIAAGVPKAAVDRLEVGGSRFRQYEKKLDKVELLADEDEIQFERESLVVVHTPGHTPGSICLLRKSSRLMFSADTILKNITPNPVLNPDPVNPKKRFQSLGEYLVSLAKIRSIAPTLLKGGHGDDVQDYEEYFNRLRHFTDVRQQKLLSMLPKQGTTAWDAAQVLFPGANGENRFLALSETVAHLDFAVSEGRLAVEKSGDAEIFRR
ncbi:MAG TPA: MBL fold metallo-hydrolase [Blastocatellia bacterium]|nr:MBL fold metallo-hydrolase [Blastocatellia bacterium]